MSSTWKSLVKSMDLPNHRKYDLPENLTWFIKNGAISNKNNPNFEAAMKYAKDQTRYGSFSDNDRYNR